LEDCWTPRVEGIGGVFSIFRNPPSKLNPRLSIGFDLAGMIDFR
jgi:hypothetical protein